MTHEDLTDPLKFAELSCKTLDALDDEAILANASFVVGKGDEYLADWYDRLAQSIRSRREESIGDGEAEGAPDSGADAAAG